MSKAISVHQFGGPEVLQFEETAVGSPGPGQIKVRHKAIGLNFIDVYHRTGLYPNELPFIPGSEAAGEIMAVGAGVDYFKPGDRICYYGPMGSYTQERLMPADKALPLPDDISFETAAAVTLKGMTVCYLLTMIWPLKKDDVILFHAAAGGVGSLAVQWAKTLGLKVIGTVGSEDKIARVLATGADEVINLSEENFEERVKVLTAGRGVDVVYDSIGKETFEASLSCLKPRGLMVSFGNASGPVTIPNLGVLAAKGSLFLTRPTLAHYFSNRETAVQAVEKLFDHVRRGNLSVHIGQRFDLAHAADAHRALEARETVGSTILIP